MIEETARHLGHLDTARELLDADTYWPGPGQNKWLTLNPAHGV
jgi:hypothetical protein